jgi:hypothetical protein
MAHILGTVLFAELINDLLNVTDELAVKDAALETSREVNVKLAETRVIANDYVFVVLVNDHGGCAENDEVVVHNDHSVVEVGLLKNAIHALSALGKPAGDVGGLVLETDDLELEPRGHWVRETGVEAAGQSAGGYSRGVVDNGLVNSETTRGLIWGNEPLVAAGEDELSEFGPMAPIGVSVGTEASEAPFGPLAEVLICFGLSQCAIL